MSFELVVTSVPKGLKPGSRGFASVGFTEGMPANYVQFCESISGYVHVFTPEDPNYTKNPPAFSHLLASLGGKTFSILSRVGSCGTDYTGRTNKLAHHLMISPDERTAPGPAVLMSRGGMFMEQWSGPPRFFPLNSSKFPDQDVTTFKATAWEQMMGEGDGAGILAQTFLDAPSKPAFILFEPGMDILPLLAEAQALLPTERRWDVTFNTYFTTLPVGMECSWRCCLPDSDALKVARRTPGVLIIDLPNRRIDGPRPVDTRLIQCARTGQPPEPPRQVQSSPVLKTVARAEQGQRGTAIRQPQRLATPAIKMNYGDALRPRPPKQTGQPKAAMWIALGLGAVVLLASVIWFKIARQRPTVAVEPGEAKTNVVEEAAPVVVGELGRPTSTVSIITGGMTSTAGVANVKVVANKPVPPKPEVAEIPVSTPQRTNEQPKAEPCVTQVVGLADNKLQLPSGTNFSLRFWGTNGTEITQIYKPNGMDGPCFVASNLNITLAHLKQSTGAPQLSGISPTVQLVELASAATNRLYVKEPFDVSPVLSRANGEYQLNLPQTEAGKLVMNYLSATSMKVTSSGHRGEVQSELVCEKLSVTSGLVIRAGDDSPLRKEEQALSKTNADCSSRIADITKHEEELSSFVASISNAAAAFDAAGARIKKNKDASKTERERNECERTKTKLRDYMRESLVCYLSSTNLAAKSRSPIIHLNEFRKGDIKDVKEALKKREKLIADQMRIDDDYSRSDCKCLFSLIDSDVIEPSLMKVAWDLYADKGLITKRLHDLGVAKQDEEADKKKAETKLEDLKKKPVEIVLKCGDVQVFRGTTVGQ